MQPTPKQKDYLLILFNDCGFNHTSRNAWLTHHYKRLIHNLDDLSKVEASEIINKLKEIKESKTS